MSSVELTLVVTGLALLGLYFWLMLSTVIQFFSRLVKEAPRTWFLLAWWRQREAATSIEKLVKIQIAKRCKTGFTLLAAMTAATHFLMVVVILAKFTTDDPHWSFAQTVVLYLTFFIVWFPLRWPASVNDKTIGTWYSLLMLIPIAYTVAAPNAQEAMRTVRALWFGRAFGGLACPRARLALFTNVAVSIVNVIVKFNMSLRQFVMEEVYQLLLVLGANMAILMLQRNLAAQDVQANARQCERGAITTLLNTVCEAVVELDKEGRIVDRAPRLAATLLQGADRSLQGATFSQFLATDADRLEFEGRLSAKSVKEEEPPPLRGFSGGFGSGSSVGGGSKSSGDSGAGGANGGGGGSGDDADLAAGTTVVFCRDALGSLLKVELLHVPFNGVDGNRRHLVGIREPYESCIGGLLRPKRSTVSPMPEALGPTNFGRAESSARGKIVAPNRSHDPLGSIGSLNPVGNGSSRSGAVADRGGERPSKSEASEQAAEDSGAGTELRFDADSFKVLPSAQPLVVGAAGPCPPGTDLRQWLPPCAGNDGFLDEVYRRAASLEKRQRGRGGQEVKFSARMVVQPPSSTGSSSVKRYAVKAEFTLAVVFQAELEGGGEGSGGEGGGRQLRPSKSSAAGSDSGAVVIASAAIRSVQQLGEGGGGKLGLGRRRPPLVGADAPSAKAQAAQVQAGHGISSQTITLGARHSDDEDGSGADYSTGGPTKKEGEAAVHTQDEHPPAWLGVTFAAWPLDPRKEAALVGPEARLLPPLPAASGDGDGDDDGGHAPPAVHLCKEEPVAMCGVCNFV